LFWALTIYFFYRYIYKNDTKSIYLAGVTAGLLMLSKYTGVLLLAGLFLFLLISKKRKLLFKKEVLISILLVFILFLPVLIWNYNHDWVSFKFQFSHGVSQNKSFNLNYPGEFLGGQLVAFNPLFFLLMFYLLFKNFREIIKNKYLLLLFCPFLVTFLFFLYQGMFKSSEVNWPAPAYITATVILAYYIDKFEYKKLYRAGLLIAVILLVIVRFPMLIPGFPEESILLNKFAGYNKIYAHAGEYIEQDEIILSDSYQNAAIAEYYLPGKPEVYIITKSRISNYNYWSKEIKEKIKNGRVKAAVFIGQQKPVAELKRYFENVKRENVITYDGKNIVRNYFIYKCRN